MHGPRGGGVLRTPVRLHENRATAGCGHPSREREECVSERDDGAGSLGAGAMPEPAPWPTPESTPESAPPLRITDLGLVRGMGPTCSAHQSRVRIVVRAPALPSVPMCTAPMPFFAG